MTNIFLIVDETVPIIQKTIETSRINWWMLVAIVELVIILLLIRISKRNDKKIKFKEEALKESVDFRNIVDSSFNATKLYNDMIRKCHPDRFIGDEQKMAIANELSAAITDNKNNVKKLEELKITARDKLGINL